MKGIIGTILAGIVAGVALGILLSSDKSTKTD